MKKTFSLLAVGLFAAVTALANLPTYKTVNGFGNGTAGAIAYLPADPNSQIRVIYVSYGSDTNKAALNFTTGTTAYWQTATNVASSSVTNQINSTNGLSANATLILEHGGVPYTATVSSWNSSTNAGTAGGTNVVLSSGGWGVNVSVGDNIYLMSSATALPIGQGTNQLAGDAIFVGNYGRPVQAQLTPANLSNSLYSVSAHYDSQSQ